MSNNINAFVIMPFDPEFTSIYEQLIKPALEDAGYDVTRADSSIDQQNILKDIIKGIITANLIVADLTAINPNVLYELGIAHGFKIPTILLTQSIETMPFDLRSYRMIQYSVRFDEVQKLKEKIKEIAEKHKLQKVNFGSPVTDFLSVQDTQTEKPVSSAPETEIQAPKKTDNDKGFLDFLVEGDEAAKDLGVILSEFTQETENIGNKMKEHTTSIQSITNNPRTGVANQMHKIAIIVGSDMSNYSVKIEEKLPNFDKDIDKFIENYTGYFTLIKPISEHDRDALLKHKQSIAELLNANQQGLDGVRSFRKSAQDLNKLNISREINRATNRMSQTLYNLISLMEKIEAFCIRATNLIDEKLKI